MRDLNEKLMNNLRYNIDDSLGYSLRFSSSAVANDRFGNSLGDSLRHNLYQTAQSEQNVEELNDT